MLGDTEGRRREQQRMSQLDGITNSMDISSSKLQEIVKDSRKPGVLQSTGLQRVRHDLVTEQQQLHSTHTQKKNHFRYHQGQGSKVIVCLSEMWIRTYWNLSL